MPNDLVARLTRRAVALREEHEKSARFYGPALKGEPTLIADLDEAAMEIGRLREALRMPDADRRLWRLSEIIATVGHFNRADLCREFGVSIPQASKDIGRWLEAHPHASTYNRSAKRYERAPVPGCA